MKKFAMILMFCILVGFCLVYADTVPETYVTVTFSQTVPDNSITWTNTPANSSSSSSSTSSEYIGEFLNEEAYQAWQNGTGDFDNIVEDHYLNTTTTTTTTVVYIPVDLTFTLWDTVTWDKADAANWFNGQDGKQANNTYDYDWSKAWGRGDSKEARTFQIRSDSKQAVTDLTNNLDGLYAKLFPLQTQIYNLIQNIDKYIVNPSQDKPHSTMMSELAKLRREEYELKKDISSTRATLLNTQGNGDLGWKVETYTSTAETTSITTTPHDWDNLGCFVASTTFGDGKNIEEAWRREGFIPVQVNNMLVAGKVVPTGHYDGLVYMFYDAAGNPLLPGSVTHNHPILTPAMLQYKAADEIRAGDEVIRGNNEVVTVARVETRYYEGPVFNVSIRGAFGFAESNYIVTKGMKK